MLNIVTGYKGTPHVTSAQSRAINRGTFGNGSYVLNYGLNLEAVIYSNNYVRIRSGAVCHQGCVGVIDIGTRDDVFIANGAQGMNRKDLIVCRYTKNADTNVEALALVCIQGTATEGTPTVPSYVTGQIDEGDSPVDMPMYVVNIEGTEITSLESQFTIVATQSDTDAIIGNSELPTAAQTLTGAIGETYRRTRLPYGKGTYNINRLNGVYGFKGTGGSLTLNIPLTIRSDITAIQITALKASLRNVAGSYVYTTSAEMASLIQSVEISERQPLIKVTLSSSDFVAANNTPVIGEITNATLVLS